METAAAKHHDRPLNQSLVSFVSENTKRVECTRLCFRIQRYWRLNVHGY